MARKTKKKTNRMPPLSFIDQTIYWIVFLMGAAVVVGYFAGFVWLRNRFAFADQTVVAARETAGFLGILPSSLYLFLLLFIPWAMWYEKKRPILGSGVSNTVRQNGPRFTRCL